MSTNVMPQKPRKLYKVINFILILINLNGALATYSIYSFDDLQFHERLFIIIPSVILTAFMIIKEFKVKPLLKRIYLNLIILSGYILIYLYMYMVW